MESESFLQPESNINTIKADVETLLSEIGDPHITLGDVHETSLPQDIRGREEVMIRTVMYYKRGQPDEKEHAFTLSKGASPVPYIREWYERVSGKKIQVSSEEEVTA